MPAGEWTTARDRPFGAARLAMSPNIWPGCSSTTVPTRLGALTDPFSPDLRARGGQADRRRGPRARGDWARGHGRSASCCSGGMRRGALPSNLTHCGIRVTGR